MKTKIMKMMVAALALASFGLVGCEPSKDAEDPVNITVKDADGNKYPTMKIGQQIWMAKNLNVNIEGSMCYAYEPEYCETYGRLYTWEAAMKACPEGWHLPSKDEMESFIEAVKVRVDQIVTQKKLNAEPLKKGEDAFYNHLFDSSVGGWDTFGFSALPAGYYSSYRKEFDYLGRSIHFWTSTEIYGDDAYCLSAGVGGASVVYKVKLFGFSVRCLRD